MKIEKNKIVFGAVLATVLIFIVAYSLLILGGDKDESTELKQTLVPELEEEQEAYTSKLDAINALKEVRETNAPSIYDEKLIDSLGFYDRNLTEKEKERIVDSIYNQGRINYTDNSYRKQRADTNTKPTQVQKDTISKFEIAEASSISAKELGLEHQLFFSSDPAENQDNLLRKTDENIYVTVDGNQIVKKDYRLRMRLTQDALINDSIVPKNTPVYGFMRFQPNRAFIEISTINHQPVKLKAFDLQDGSEGIYVENSFRADASREVIDDIVQDINIAGVPQVRGIKTIFQRNNRNVKVTIVNNYKLILKASQGH